MKDIIDDGCKICHLFLSPLQGESRLFKELATAEKLFPAETLLTIGLDRDGQELSGLLQGRYPFQRIRLRSRNLPKKLPFHLVKFVEWTLRAAWRARASGARILHCHSLPALPATVLARLLSPGSRILYDAHELETKRANMSPSRQKATALLERMLMPFVSEALVVGPSILDSYRKRYRAKQFTLLLNLPTQVELQPSNSLREKFGIPAGRPIIIYVGALAPMRGIDLLLEAMEGLEDWHCVFLGEGPLSAQIAEAARFNKRIHHHPPVPENEVVNVVAQADLSYSVIDCSAESYRFAMPNKYFQSLVAGVPVVANEENLDILVTGAKTGMVFGVNYDAAAIREFIRSFPEMKVPRASQNFSWEAQEDQLIEVYERLLGNLSSAR